MSTAESVISEHSDEQIPASAMNGDEVLARLKAATGSTSDSALAAFLKVPYSTLASWRRRNAVPIEMIIAVSDISGSTVDWLLLGKAANGQVQSEASVQPATPYVSRTALNYGFQFYSIVFGNKVENLRKSIDGLIASCIAAQSTIDQAIQFYGGDEEQVENQMKLWITRTILNVQAQGKQVD